MAIDPTTGRHAGYDPTGVGPRPMYADDYGTCAVCGREHRLTARGNVYQHRKRDHLDFATHEQCDGAGKPPRMAGS